MSAPATYTETQLQALPQVTLPRARPGAHSVTGVSLEALVQLAMPILPAGAKNALLRVTVQVTGLRSVTVALGELDPRFGNHPAVLALGGDGIPSVLGSELVIPGDTSNARTVFLVRRITISVQNPVRIAPPHSGDLEIEHDGHATVLSASRLASLPAKTVAVSFLGPRGIQHHTETGPTLRTVLAAAGVESDPDTWVAGVGSDGYVATVTPAEAEFGGRPLFIATVQDGISLAQPRLIVDGDVSGGRYVSDLFDLVVGEGARAPACALAPLGCPLLAPAHDLPESVDPPWGGTLQGPLGGTLKG